MKDKYYFTGESFGADCPENWQEIIDYLNRKIDELPDSIFENEQDASDATEKIWDEYCSGHFADAPEADI